MRFAGADLHIHTTHSDGSCSPGEVVRAAAQLGLSALAITDHDTVSAHAVAQPEADRLSIELIAGIELTAESDGRELHVLGHFIDPENVELLAATSTVRRQRNDRIQTMVERLQSLGYSVDHASLVRSFPRAALGRRHLADWLIKTGQTASHRETFARLLGEEGLAFVPKPRLAADQAIALIRQSGGVAGLAHPWPDLRESTLRRLVDDGLAAIEVTGPAISATRGRRWREWASRFDLVPIAGSDFHVSDRPGRWLGSVITPDVDLARLRNARN